MEITFNLKGREKIVNTEEIFQNKFKREEILIEELNRGGIFGIETSRGKAVVIVKDPQNKEVQLALFSVDNKGWKKTCSTSPQKARKSFKKGSRNRIGLTLTGKIKELYLP